MSAIFQQKQMFDWAKGGILGILIYWIPTGLLITYTLGDVDIIGQNARYDHPILIFCLLVMNFWPEFVGLGGHISKIGDLAVIFISSSLIWFLLGALLAKWLGFSRGGKLLLVLAVSAFCIGMGYYYFISWLLQ